ncbi:MAG: hypothetical protein M3454_05550 [Actinomycetota bacterium]|nr:hypothetical protein [Actinomycetota bacterium]
MSQTCVVIAALSLLACPSQNGSPQLVAKPQKDVLQEMVVHPENFHLGQEVEVTGALIRPSRNSAKFICKEVGLSNSDSPTGKFCVAVSGSPSKPGGGLDIHELSGAQWNEKRAWIPYRVTVPCSVDAFMPGTPPERLVLLCDWSSLK